MNRYIGIVSLLLILLCGCSHHPQTEISSPDGTIKIYFCLNDSNRMAYRISINDSSFIAPSQLGFEANNGINLYKDFQITGTDFSTKDEVWTQPWGENKSIRNHYNEVAIHLKDSKATRLTIRFRAFDDGIGFRYEYQVPNIDSLFIINELTEFNIANNGVSWSIPANFETYELLYRTLPINKVETANTPMTFKTDNDIYASIHEAALTDFPEMTLKQTEACNFKSELAPWPDGIKARFAGGNVTTPWRTIQIAKEAVGLINSGLILNLNEPCALETTDWIKPMKYVGIWWGMHLGVETWTMDDRHGATTENAKRYIDFAAANNIEAVMFEGWNEGWESWGGMQTFDYTKPYADFDIVEVARYAKEKNIQIIGHHETGGNIPNYERQLDKAYKWYADLGIHSVKTGYAGAYPGGYWHHSQYGVRHYRKVVETAAKYHTTIDAHEPIKDTGIRRTYPNMMTREGARGMEWNGWSEGNPPEHHELLPFTRLLAGPMDYTPGTFDILYEKTRNSPKRKKWNDLDKGNSRVNTTLAKQIANWVILYSPLQMASDMIENYENHPAFQFFRDFDADCDWSRALAGEPGEFVVVVRKAKQNYFLGASTNEEARTINIKLDFLEKGELYKATIYADGKDANWETNPTDYQITEQIVTANESLSITMATGGGQAISFMPVDE
ncbi:MULTISPECIES: glycoside hydrolase family 97 protein [unclassified Bacteroides]|jgi:alpha-glucosidase|uniref:glycoside hydrolase family 97 protein n=1 Tax=unclassified Bacteroides TaxID=2646097 RepID=UPI000E98FD2F|nr:MULTISPECIES: glycoside hydrolase family 97 protein [unclassified Bacteroides]RGN42423.1 glycoside hydrolase family 97 protein [Bacteroides sp. OM05-12]RHR69472.1 glycoside hydrolase family 97 protein [Bacteroides sp. AF16-49]